MGQILHGSARTTEALRRAIQHSQASIRALARRYGINPKTIAKWKRRTTTADAPMGPKAPRSTVLSKEEEAIVVAFRKHTLLPLDDCLYALQATIPHLTRSALHRCLQRHESHEQLRAHLANFLAAYNFAKRLKTLRGLTPHECVCKIWTEDPGRFRLDPIHHTTAGRTAGGPQSILED